MSASFAIDSDHDGLPDDYELANDRDPLIADYQISVTDSFACLLADGSITCWGKYDDGQLNAPQLDNIKQIDTAYSNVTSYTSSGDVTVEASVACALHDSRVSCWGSNEFGLLDVPQLTSPTKISLDGGIGCALDVNGVHCWGEYGGWGSPTRTFFSDADFDGIVDIFVSGFYLYILDANAVYRAHLYSIYNDLTTMIDGLSNPSILSDGACVLDDNGVVCAESYIADVPNLDNPTYISAGSLNACAVDDGSVKCWGQRPEFSNIPNLDGAYSLDVSRWVACALDKNGVKCWGGNDSTILNAKVVPLMIDPDNYGVSNQNGEDVFPFDSSEALDTDKDGIGNNADADDDGDNVIDSNDTWPLDRRYSSDTDGDGLPDSYELANGYDPNDSSDASTDSDGDSLTKLQEFGYGTSDRNVDSDFDTLPDNWEIENDRDPAKEDYAVVMAHSFACAKTDDGLNCWKGGRSFPAPTMNSAFSLDAGSNSVCAIEDGEVQCWGEGSPSSSYENPMFTNATLVRSAHNIGCAIDSGIVKCWGAGSSFEIPTLINPREIDVANGVKPYACAIDDEGVKCWGEGMPSNKSDPFPDAVNPRMISAGHDEICILHDAGGSCLPSGYATVTLPADTTFVHVDVYDRCYISGGTVTCSGVINTTGKPIADRLPSLTNPQRLVTGSGSYDKVCVLSNEGISCIGLDTSNFKIDPDGDGYTNQGGLDAFPLDSTEWLDTDNDGVGNNADPDDDGDSVLDATDAFPLDASESLDSDGDGLGDNADIFPNDAGETIDSDTDGIGDNSDNCVNVANTNQINSDDDLLGNACDEDDDNDGLSDQFDIFPLDASEQVDSDEDGVGDNGDAFPLDSSEWLDTDSDGIGNNADNDDDGDGIQDSNDAFPLDGLYIADSDNDGMPDSWEIRYGLDPNDPTDAASDTDNDGVTALDEYLAGTIPSGSLDIDGNGQYDALTDGLLLLRGMFGLTNDALINGALASNAQYTSGEEIKERIDTLGDLVDIDGNGQVDALTDGLVILRYLFGLRGDVLINGVIASNATITDANGIDSKIDSLKPAL